MGGWRGDGLKVGWGQQLAPGRRPPGLKSQPYHCLARPSPLPEGLLSVQGEVGSTERASLCDVPGNLLSIFSKSRF